MWYDSPSACLCCVYDGINEKHVAAFLFTLDLLLFFVPLFRSFVRSAGDRPLNSYAIIPGFFSTHSACIFSLFSFSLRTGFVLNDEWISLWPVRITKHTHTFEWVRIESSCLHAKRKKRQKPNVSTLKRKHTGKKVAVHYRKLDLRVNRQRGILAPKKMIYSRRVSRMNEL